MKKVGKTSSLPEASQTQDVGSLVPSKGKPIIGGTLAEYFAFSSGGIFKFQAKLVTLGYSGMGSWMDQW